VRGFHILMHGMCYAPFNSKLAYSADAINWHINLDVQPYGYEATFTDANDGLVVNETKETFWRVERPQIVFGKVYANFSLANPIALFNGVCGDGIECLDQSEKVRLKTWTLARPFRGQ